MGKPGHAAEPIKTSMLTCTAEDPLPTDAKENGEELRIGQASCALRQQPLTRTFAFRPLGNTVPSFLAAIHSPRTKI